MKEKRMLVQAYMVCLMCDKCDGGEMKPTGICLTSLPPQYPHRCDQCGHEETVRGKTYPHHEYVKCSPEVPQDPSASDSHE